MRTDVLRFLNALCSFDSVYHYQFHSFHITLITHIFFSLPIRKNARKKFVSKHSRAHFFAFSGNFEDNAPRNLTIFAQPNEILSRDEIRQKGAIKNTFLTNFALITKNFAKNRNRQIFTFNFTSSLRLFSQKKLFVISFSAENKHEEPKKKSQQKK